MFKPSSNFHIDNNMAVLHFWMLFNYYCFMFVCHVFLSVHYSFVVNWWENADLLVLLHVIFSCVFVTFSYGILGRLW